jgi:hypothetical protein
MQPPANLDLDQSRFLGFLTLRQTLIAAAGLGGGVFILAALGGLELYLRAMLLVAWTGSCLALMFGQVEGRTLEQWLFDLAGFHRRARVLVHGGQNAPADTRRVTLPTENETAPPARVTLETARPRRGTNFFLLLAETASLALITGLTIWLWQGGAAQLQRLAHGGGF